MEKGLDKCLEEVASLPGVLGVLCADQQGLCLQSKGKVSNIDGAAGAVVELTEAVAKLEPDLQETPSIVLESDQMNIYIKKVGQVSTAIFKTPNKD